MIHFLLLYNSIWYYIVEILSLLSVLGAVVLYIIYWIKAPNIVPIHYNIYGEADGYGSKTVLVILPILSVLMYVGLTILKKYPHIFNFPITVTEQNALSLYKMAKIIDLSLIYLFYIRRYKSEYDFLF